MFPLPGIVTESSPACFVNVSGTYFWSEFSVCVAEPRAMRIRTAAR